MADLAAWLKWRPTPVGLAATGAVVLGLALTTVSWGFFTLVALGAFGPGILRELGWLRDQDEFQRRAAHRAGYHAYLAGGLVALLLVAYVRSGERQIEHPEELTTLLLVVLWFTWLFSSVLAYWGAQRAASRILIAFGSFWLLFVVLSHLTEPIALLMEALVPAPFFLLAWLSLRWPRVAGALLLAAALFAFVFFGMDLSMIDRPGRAITFVLLVVPLLGCGIALLRAGPGEGEDR